MSDQQQILPCIVCSQQHQQMLMLSCLHDPCINCAAIHYVENAIKNTLLYPCSKCNEETQLDTSSVVELQRVYRMLKPAYEEKKYNYNRNVSSREKSTQNGGTGKNSRTKLLQNNHSNTDAYSYLNHNHNLNSNKSQKYSAVSMASEKHDPVSYYNNSTSNLMIDKNLNSSSNLNHYQATTTSIAQKKNLHTTTYLMCHEHPEDQLTYFCFTCNKPICPECAIHGAHREHEVQTTRRAIKQIKSRLTDFNEKLSTQIGHLMHRKEQGRKNLKQLADLHKRDHDQVKKQFNRLRACLVEKQKQLLHLITQNYQNNCQQTKKFTLSMDKMVESYNNIRKNIDVTLKRDDLTVLQEFNKRQDEANQILDRNSGKSQQEKLVNPQHIDYRSLEEQIREFVGVMEAMRLVFGREKVDDKQDY